MTAPAEGFAASGLAQLFGSNSVASSAASPSQSPEPLGSNRVRHVIIAGAVVGGAVFLGLVSGVVWLCRRSLHRMLIGDVTERLEIDGKCRHNSELAGNTVFWELPGSGPAELWSPTVSPEEEVDQFKFETKSDRDLGWRGEIECEGAATKAECIKEKGDQENRISRDTK